MAKEIQLTQGQVALVDDEDYEALSQWKWYAHRNYNTFYARRNISLTNGKQVMVLMHHAIIGRPNPGLKTDHKDGDGLNNQRYNIHYVTNRQNSQNKRYYNRDKPSSQYPGVSWAKHAKKWRARIQINGKYKHLGYFEEELDAAQTYENAVEEIGEVITQI